MVRSVRFIVEFRTTLDRTAAWKSMTGDLRGHNTLEILPTMVPLLETCRHPEMVSLRGGEVANERGAVTASLEVEII